MDCRLFLLYLFSKFHSPVSNAKRHSSEVPSEGAARSTVDNTLVFHPAHIDEGALWNAFKSGNETALVSIFDRYVKVLYNYGIKIYQDRESVEDTVQELFIELWKNRKNLSDTDSIKFYLFKALRFKLQRVRKSRISRDLLSLSQVDDGVAPSHEFFVIAEQTMYEQRQRLLKMLDSLTPRQREAIFLRYFEEMSYERIAEIMEMNKQSVYNLIHAGIAQLRESL